MKTKHFLSSLALVAFMYGRYANNALGQNSISQNENGLTKPLGLEEAKKMALNNNAQLKVTAAQTAVSKADLYETSAFFLPQFTVSETGVFTNAPLHAFGFKLMQRNVTMFDFDPARLTDPGDEKNFITQAELKMPLLNAEGYWYRKAAKTGVSANQLKESYAKEAVGFAVTQVYYGIKLAEASLKVIDAAEKATQSALTLVRNAKEVGYRLKSDELALEVRVSELAGHRLQVVEQYENYLQMLRELMGDTNLTIYKLTDTLSTDVSLAAPTPNTDLSKRADFVAWRSGLQAQRLLIQAERYKTLPTFNAFGNYQFHDRYLFGTRSGYYMAGFQLEWKLFTGLQRSAKIAKAKAELKVTEAQFYAYSQTESRILKEAENKWGRLKQELTSATLAVQQAEEAYRIRNDRFEQGLERTTDILSAEASLFQQRLRVAQAQFMLYVANEHLKLLTSQNQ